MAKRILELNNETIEIKDNNWLMIDSPDESGPTYKIQFGIIRKALTTNQTAYIIKTGTTNNIWFRIWSDGWCEQGGKVLRPADYGGGTYKKRVILKIPYIDNNYFITTTALSKYRNGYGNCGYAAYIEEIENDKFYPIMCNNTANNNGHYYGFYWETKGMIDLDKINIDKL